VEAAGAPAARIAVWDAPVRLFHWVLAVLVVFSFITGKVAGSWLEWHMRSGYAILALVAFRIAWGFVGSETARFSHFVRGPRAALDYVKATLAKRHPRVIGHNPLGGWMVLFMLLVVAVQAVSGLFMDDEIATQGPLAVKVSNAFVAKMSSLHRYNTWTIAGMVALHLAAIATYFWALRTNLVGPMVYGTMAADPGTPAPRVASNVLAVVILAVAGTVVYWLVYIFPKGGG
jgi:cytochrome b